MLFQSLLAALAASSFVQAVPVSSPYAVHQKRDAPSSQWVRRNRVERSAVMPMRIALNQRDLHKGYDFVMDVYVFNREPALR